jgi:hypothetical protein
VTYTRGLTGRKGGRKPMTDRKTFCYISHESESGMKKEGKRYREKEWSRSKRKNQSS